MTTTSRPRFASIFRSRFAETLALSALFALLAACAALLPADDLSSLPDDIVPLLQAVKQGDEKSVVFHLEKDQEGTVNTEWNNGWMPLHVAVDEGHLAIAELLLDHGAPTDTLAGWYSTPLHIAASANDIKMVQMLIEKGVDVNVRSKPLIDEEDGDLALAEKYGDGTMVDTLIKASTGDLALDRAEEYGYGIIVDMLIAAGTVVPEDYDSGIMPLHNAITQNDAEEVERLLAAGADANARTRLNATPLLFAVQQQNIDIVKMLIAHGADMKATHEYDETLLHEAAFAGDPGIVQLFLDSGIDVNAKSAFGQTPLHKTTIGDEISAAWLLLENGADVNAVDDSSETPLDVANFYGGDNKEEMIALLREYGGEEAPEDQEYPQ